MSIPIKGTDLSEYIAAVNWPHLITDGYGNFTTVRACDGFYKDKLHDTHVANAIANNVPVGSYQYGHPSMDVKKVAEAYLAIVDKAHAQGRDRLRHVIDMESLVTTANGQKVVPDTAGEWTDAWCEIVKYETGSEPIIYASAYYAIAMMKQVPSLLGPTGWDFWCADYTGTPTHPTTVGGLTIPVYLSHQYAGDVHLPNQAGLWDLDAVYDDSIDRLRMAA